MEVSTEELLAVLRQRFPQELEVAVLMVQNDSLRRQLAELEDGEAKND